MEDDSYDCDICGKAFATPNGLRNHQLSKIHERKDLNCVICRRIFRTPGHMFLHLERSEVCKQSILPSILKSVEAWEADTGRRHFFTSEGSKPDVPDRDHISRQLTATRCSRKLAIDASNGKSDECPLCNRAFKKESGLEQHLSSKVHKKAAYSCKSCRKEFRSLSALLQHLESESCPWMGFDAVKKEVYSLLLNACAAKLRQQP